MRKILLFSTFLVFLLFLSRITFYAQVAFSGNAGQYLPVQERSPTNPASISVKDSNIYVGADTGVDAEADFPMVFKRFRKLFPDAEHQTWEKRPDAYLAYFINNGYKTTASFSMEGKLIYAICEKDKKGLPSYIVEQLERQYPEFVVCNVKEIICKGANFYYVLLEDKVVYLQLLFTPFGSEEVQRILRSTSN